ncbi:nucleotidyltransferase family protein [Roseovarius sp. ZX-A-9]|uniref:nucleotidyltransferase family protein n=1 Tax=Roseovarius sp. ZX-A-9 TaxID=3014783 RepID=UPI00232ADE1B|nr:nucleotidyltransferase family protein [Roseovarius sp. ZX-A-9]
MNIAILMPAAGASSRMRGRDKLLEPVGGVPLLARQVGRAMATQLPVYVTTRADRPARIAALKALPRNGLHRVPVGTPDEGLAASIRAGLAGLPADTEALMVLLPDLPDIGTDDILAMIAAFRKSPDRILRAATEDGRPGHPVILPKRTFATLAQLQGDTGAAALLRANPPRLFPLTGERAITDLDTPEDWANWRRKGGV